MPREVFKESDVALLKHAALEDGVCPQALAKLSSRALNTRVIRKGWAPFEVPGKCIRAYMAASVPDESGNVFRLPHTIVCGSV